MALISMKRTKSEMKGDSPETVSRSKEKFPWGLSITLEKEELKKLGLDIDDFEPGKIVYLHSEAKITGTHISASDSGEGSKSVSLQITRMDLGQSKSDLDWETPSHKADKILIEKGISK